MIKTNTGKNACATWVLSARLFISKSQPECGLYTAHLVGGGWQSELGAAYVCVPIGKRNVVQGVRGVDPQVGIQAVGHAECSSQARIQSELSRTNNGISSSVSPLAICRRSVGGGVQKEPWRRGVDVLAGIVRADAARDAGAAHRRNVDRSKRQTTAGVALRYESPLLAPSTFPSGTQR